MTGFIIHALAALPALGIVGTVLAMSNWFERRQDEERRRRDREDMARLRAEQARFRWQEKKRRLFPNRRRSVV